MRGDASLTRQIRRLLDWPMQRQLRRSGLPDLPEVRRALRAWSAWGWSHWCFTLRPVPSRRELRALHDEAVAAIRRVLPDEDAL